jgi:hypothetical protein
VTGIVHDFKIVTTIAANFDKRINSFADFCMTFGVGNSKFLDIVVIYIFQDMAKSTYLTIDRQFRVLRLPADQKNIHPRIP